MLYHKKACLVEVWVPEQENLSARARARFPPTRYAYITTIILIEPPAY